jgi:hypothetical protein
MRNTFLTWFCTFCSADFGALALLLVLLLLGACEFVVAVELLLGLGIEEVELFVLAL